jgi:hypothetical protein
LSGGVLRTFMRQVVRESASPRHGMTQVAPAGLE